MAGSPFNALTAVRHANLIRAVLGEEAHFESVSPELGLTHVLESDRPEWHHPGGSVLWAIRLALNAVAAVFGYTGIRNPAGSGLLVVVTDIGVSNSALVAQLPELKIGTQAADTGFTVAGVFSRDLRRGVATTSSVQSLVNTSAGIFGSGPVEVQQLAAGEGDRTFGSPPYVLPPGFDIFVKTGLVNQALDTDWAGYARQAKPEELV